MFRIFNFTKKHFRDQPGNDYPIGMDTMPTISPYIDNKASIKNITVNGQISGNPVYRLIKKRRNNRHK